jgi:hypothetical protein
MSFVPYVKTGGLWKFVKSLFIKIGATWTPVKAAWVKDGGVWKQFYTAGWVLRWPTNVWSLSGVGDPGPQQGAITIPAGQEPFLGSSIVTIEITTTYEVDSNNIPIRVAFWGAAVWLASMTYTGNLRITNLTTGFTVSLVYAGFGAFSRFAASINNPNPGFPQPHPYAQLVRQGQTDMYRIEQI